MLADPCRRPAGGRAELLGRLVERRDRSDADVLAVEQLEPGRERATREDRGELGCERLLAARVELARGELGPPDELAEPREELRLQRADGEVAPVGGLVDAVAGEPAREKARQRVAAQPVRDEPVRAVRHRDGDPGAAAGALALEQGGQHLRDGAERSGGEVGGLQRGHGRRRVGEHAGPAEVVQVVTGSRRVSPIEPEAGDRAVDDGVGNVFRPDAEPRRDARPKPLEHDVRPGADSPCELPRPPADRRRPTPCPR